MCSILPLAMNKPDFQAMRTQLMVSINPIISRVLFWRVKANVPVETIYIQGIAYIFTLLVIIIILINQVNTPIYDFLYKVVNISIGLIATYIIFAALKFR